MDQIAWEPLELDAHRVAQLDTAEHSTIYAARGVINPILYPAGYTANVPGVSLSRPGMAAVSFQR